MSKPNFILIMADQMRGDCLSADGHPVIQTPNLDQIGGKGYRFKHGYTAVPSCLPARATLMSGQDQWHAGLLGMGRGQGPTPNDYPHTLAGELTKAGYRTHLIGKGHFTPQWTPMGFETRELDESGRTFMLSGIPDDYRKWFADNADKNITPDDHGVYWNSWHANPWHTEEHLHPTKWTMDRSLEFIKNRDKERPFFLNISFARPHSPYVPPKSLFDRYMNLDLPKPSVGDWANLYADENGPLEGNAWKGVMPEEMIRRANAGYYGEISFIDQQIGRLLHHLWRFDRELLDNTWIIFTADHGDMQGDHNLWRKTYAYEGSTRIPFMVAPAGAFKGPIDEFGEVKEQVVELRDIMPTILEAAGLEIPKTVTGASMLPIMQDDSAPWREYLHGEHCWCYSRDQEMQYVTDGKRKYVWLPRIDVHQFFDLEADPGERHNLIDDANRQDEIAKWRQFMINELESRDCGWVVNGKLHCPGDEPMVSPYRDVRYQGE
jgi:arylsulfatase A-like enzyme